MAFMDVPPMENMPMNEGRVQLHTNFGCRTSRKSQIFLHITIEQCSNRGSTGEKLFKHKC